MAYQPKIVFFSSLTKNNIILYIQVLLMEYALYRKELVATSSLFIVPIYAHHLRNIPIPRIIEDLIILQGCISIVFWWNPVGNRNTIIHKVDKILAVFSISSVVGYKIMHNPTPLFTFSTLVMFYFFYLSNVYSRRAWCSAPHIFCHCIAHISAHNSIYLAFV